MAHVGNGTLGQVLQAKGTSGGASYSTATYPATATGTGKVLIADGTNWVASTPTFPNASASSGKFIRSDGTNWIASTPTLPTTAGTSSTILRSDGTNFVNSTPTFPNAASTAGKVIISDGTNFTTSTPTFPNASATSGKFIRSDGTNWIASTPTLPTTAGTASTLLRSDGTNWVNTSAAKISSTDIYTNTAQPTLVAYSTSNQTNATGDATQVTVIFGTVLSQQGSNYVTGTGIYTFPVAGQYLITAQVGLSNLIAGHTGAFMLVLLNGGNHFMTTTNPFATQSVAQGLATFSQTFIYQAAASDTLRVDVAVSGSTKTVTVAATNAPTFLSIALLG